MEEGKGELSQLTIANRMGEAQPRLGLARETPKKAKRTSADDSVLKNVCRSLEAAGLSVVVVVALDASPALAATGHTLRRARRSLETSGVSVVADTAAVVGMPAARRSGKAKLALVRDQEELLHPAGGKTGQDGVNTGPVIVLTTATDEAAARAAFVTGGLGYIVKPASMASAGAVAPFVVRRGDRRQQVAAVPPADPSTATVLAHGLTSRELEVLQALATGASTIEVARELYVSPKTAKNHIAHIYAKLGVSSRTQAVAKALRQGIVSID